MSFLPSEQNKNSLTYLDLSFNNLCGSTQEVLIQKLENIQPAIISLSIAQHSLGSKTGVQIHEIFKTIPETITSLCLRGNFLNKFSPPEFESLFAQIKPAVISLDLSDNNLGTLSVDTWTCILPKIPRNIAALSLRLNGLGDYSNEDLTRILAAIPKTVTTLELSQNSLEKKKSSLYDQKSIEELKAISTGLTHVQNIICGELSPEQLEALKSSAQENPHSQDLPASKPQESLNSRSIGMWVTFLSGVAEAIILLACDIAIKSALAWACVIGGPIALGAIIAIGLYLFSAPNSPTSLNTATV